MNLIEAKSVLSNVYKDLEKVSQHEEFECDYTNSDERFEANEMGLIANNLKEVVRSLKYMEKPIIGEGNLLKRPDGRYGIPGEETYFTSGSIIEVWDEEIETYYKTSIEHTDGDYFAVGFKGKSLEGMKVRFR